MWSPGPNGRSRYPSHWNGTGVACIERKSGSRLARITAASFRTNPIPGMTSGGRGALPRMYLTFEGSSWVGKIHPSLHFTARPW